MSSSETPRPAPKPWAQLVVEHLRVARFVRIAGVCLVTLGLAGCSRPPAETVDLVHTSWTVTSIGSLQLQPGAMTVVIGGDIDANGDWIAVVRTGCRTVNMGVTWDSSGDAMSWTSAPLMTSACASDLALQDRTLFAALQRVGRWSVNGAEAITLHGVDDVHLSIWTRTPLGSPASPSS
jgi:hypothetical protein